MLLYSLGSSTFRLIQIGTSSKTYKEFQSIHHRVVQLINSHKYVDDKHQRNLWLKYKWLIWIQKANQFLNDQATLQSMRILIIYVDRLLQNIDIFEEISRKIRELNEQRSGWIKKKDKDDSQNRSYKQFYKYNETKPDSKNFYIPYSQAKEIPYSKIKDLKDDIIELKQVLFAFHELVRQEQDNSQYINRLDKIRISYSLCCLKAKKFSLILIYYLIEELSLRCFKSLTPTTELLHRLNEISLLIKVGEEEWLQRINGSFKAPPSEIIDQEFKFIDNDLQDDFEWVKWLEKLLNKYMINMVVMLYQKKKKSIKIFQKKSQKEAVQESQRYKFKSQVYSLAHKFTTKINDSHIRLLESQIYMELNQDSSKYDKEYENLRIQESLLENKLVEIVIKIKGQQNVGVRNQIRNSKEGLNYSETQNYRIRLLGTYSNLKRGKLAKIKKKINQTSEEQFIQIDQKDQFLYNPDGQTETNNQKRRSS